MAGRPSEQDRERRSLIAVLVACSFGRVPTVDEQRIRLARRVSQLATSSAAGLTLVELLVTIVILGAVSAVAVFAVSGIRTQGQAAACSADGAALEAAMEAHRAAAGSYVTEPELVAAGRLREESSLHDVVLDPDVGYTLTPTGACVGDDGAVEAAGADVATLDAPTSTTTSTTSATTTTLPANVKALKLSAVCTAPDHWPDERAWRIRNRNAYDVGFVLVATNATEDPGHEIAAQAPAGDTVWFLPAADSGPNTATLTAAGRTASAKNKKSSC